MPQNKRRSTIKQKRQGEESDSDSVIDDPSPEFDDPSLSPEIHSNSHSRRSSNAGRHPQDVFTPSSLPSGSSISDRRPESLIGTSAGSSSRPKLESGIAGPRGYFPDAEVPHIATLPMNDTAPHTPAPMSAPTLPPIRPASELQAAQRKRAATMPGKSVRQSTNSGPKVVACNFCRGMLLSFGCSRNMQLISCPQLARKTKCDGAHPACASCARRQLDCNYVHDPVANGSGQKKTRRPSTPKTMTAESNSDSPPSSRMLQTLLTASDTHDIRGIDIRLDEGVELKRPLEYSEMQRSPKKMRMDIP